MLVIAGPLGCFGSDFALLVELLARMRYLGAIDSRAPRSAGATFADVNLTEFVPTRLSRR
jgi:hypothetical protein